MFRHRQRQPPPFSDFINWTDYRWDNANPWRRRGAASQPWGRPYQRPRHSFFKILLAGLAVVLGVKLMSSLRNNGNRSWVEKGVIAVLLLVVFSYITKRARQRSW